ncbi:TetR/AcrR family transcriptional regulator [Acinetobacter pullicarnis]|uniref:TetR/AcrR family transcriptional regulator n=1 Tax=Acinetobacter pullicarnis TaxID=2576829 RepID=UPI00112240C2|nr:TetR family transcriptional regulator [Acinetobacter pullicarnis]
MARRSKADMEQTRQALLSSARKSFTDHGYAATAMDELCTAAGLTRGALYHHFGDKQGLLKAVVAEMDVEMDQRLQQSFATANNTWAGLQQRCQLYLEMAQEAEIKRIILQDARAVLGQRSGTESQQCLTSLQSILQELMQAGTIHHTDSEALALLIHGSLTEASFWIADAQDSQQRLKHAVAAVQLLLNGLLVNA